MIKQITVNSINEALFSADFVKGFNCGAKRQFQADVEEISKERFKRPTGKWVWDDKGYFHCDQCGKKPNDQTRATNFCPNCGSFNGGKEE